MKAWRGRVETDIARHDLPRGKGVQSFRIGNLVDIAALFEQTQEFGFVGAHDGAPASMGICNWKRMN